MTTGTSDGQPQHRRASRGGHVVQFIVTCAFKLLLRQLRRKDTRSQKTRRHHRKRILRIDLVTRDLQPNKFIPGHVRIERLDHKIAIVVSILPVVILLKAMALRKARRIQPMPRPTLSIVRTGEKFIHQVHMAHRESRLQLLCGRRQSNHRQIRPPNPISILGLRIGKQIIFLQFCCDELVNLPLHPFPSSPWRRHLGQRLKRPKLTITIRHPHLSRTIALLLKQRLVIRCAQRDPLLKICDQGIR